MCSPFSSGYSSTSAASTKVPLKDEMSKNAKNRPSRSTAAKNTGEIRKRTNRSKENADVSHFPPQYWVDRAVVIVSLSFRCLVF